MYLSQLSGDGDIVSSEKLFKDSTVNLDGREVVRNHTGVITKCIQRCVNTRFVQAISLSLGAITEQAFRSNKPTAGSEWEHFLLHPGVYQCWLARGRPPP